MSKVYVISTGGTISMHDVNNVDNNYSFESEVIRILPSSSSYPTVEFNFDETPIDSSDMKVNNWNSIARRIYDNYDKYDGFVILHGTDTMTYTGSALSLMFANLNKPLVITGSQRPLSDLVNDARENLINAIYIAGNYKIGEVCIYFNRKLYRANRTSKFSTISYDAYHSPNHPLLATVESSISLETENLITATADKKLELTLLQRFKIRYILLMPSMDADDLATMMQGARGVIIGTYGDGNLPMLDPSFLEAIKDAHDRGVIVVNRSQCPHSNTQVEKYSDKEQMLAAGFIPAHDQSIETLSSKLLYCFSRNYSLIKTEKCLQSNMRGELTLPQTHQPTPHYTTFFASLPKEPEKDGITDIVVSAPAAQSPQLGSLSC